MEKDSNTDIECLIEAVANKCFENEPLAMALLLYLSKNNIVEYVEVIKLFDSSIKSRIENLIKSECGNGSDEKHDLSKE